MMRPTIVALALLTALSATKQGLACSIYYRSVSFPVPDATRIVGSVIGYGETIRPLLRIKRATSLRIKIETVVSGRITMGETHVVPFSYGETDGVPFFYESACDSMPFRDVAVLSNMYPIGMRIAVLGASSRFMWWDGPILVETMRGAFITPVPDDVSRTVDGDLDFARFDWSQNMQFGAFEFHRAVLALRSADQAQRFRRLLNLVIYRGFHGFHYSPDGRKQLEELISESRITDVERVAVLREFADHVPHVR